MTDYPHRNSAGGITSFQTIKEFLDGTQAECRMAKDDQRYDVSYREHGPTIDPHFCREWVGDEGCYGTNPDHGMTFREACEEVARWHESRAAEVRNMKSYNDYY